MAFKDEKNRIGSVRVLGIFIMLGTLGFFREQVLYGERVCEDVILDEKVGLYLDRFENEALGIFEVENFVRARFFRTNYDSLFAVIYCETDSGVDSSMRYITPFEEFLIRAKLKKMISLTQKEEKREDFLGLTRCIFPEFADIQIFTKSGERLDARFLSFRYNYFGIAIDSNFRKIPLNEINKIVYFNPEVEFRMLQRNFIVISSLLGMVSFDILSQIRWRNSRDRWLMRTAGLFTGFYTSYRLYRIIDMNFLKKETYILNSDGLVVVRRSFLRRFIENVSRRLEKCRGLRFL